MIEIRKLEKSFGATPVLRGIDLDVADGEILTLIGRSGSGKSTLLRCINFLEEYSSGEIRLDGKPLWYRSAEGASRTRAPEDEIRRMRQRMGVVFQQYNLFAHMTALENVCVGPRFAQKKTASEVADLAGHLLARVGLDKKRDSYPSQLSGGEQQRVAIARALAMRPKVLLLDEITSALDPELVGEVLDVMQRLATDGTTMIVVTHEMNFARDVADRVVVMDAGQVVEQGKAEEVLLAPKNPRTASFLARFHSTIGERKT